jgi:hypothetical protein
MLGSVFFIGALQSVVIDDLHVVSIAILPVEADTPLLVDPDAVLSPS